MIMMPTTHFSSDDRKTDNKSLGDDALWQRLRHFELDIPDCGLTFSERAAKENGWSLGYTRRVIEEYKRFVFLAMRAGHVACPSEDVDQIWHMHLTYTRSYWEELCGKVLERPLHHGPTKGGTEERQKYFQLYGRTKDSYRRWFSTEPPEDIWPSAEVRFGIDLHYVRVNAAKHWILPRLGWRHAAIGVGSAGGILPVAQLAANPLQWRGPQFLALFFGLLIIAALASWLARIWLLRADEPYRFQAGADDQVGPVEVAWLRGGDRAAISCAVVELANAGAIRLDGDKIQASSNAENYAPTSRLTQLILNSVATAPAGRSWQRICRDANVGLVGLKQTLEEKGLATSFSQRASASAMAVALVGGLLLFGAAKIWVGLDSGRPVGILVFGEILAGLALLVLLATNPRLTSAGQALVTRLAKHLKESPVELTGTKKTSDHENSSDDSLLLWGAALVGTDYLQSTELAEYHDYTQMHNAATNNAASGGCGATGCGGDSGCGGGGCGGCGGCGG